MLPAGQRRQPKARLPVAIQAGCIPTNFPATLSLHLAPPRADRQFGHLRNLRLTQPLVYYNLRERRGVIVRGRLLVTARGPGHPENQERVSTTFQSCQNLTPRRRRPSDFTVSRQSCRGPGSMVGRRERAASTPSRRSSRRRDALQVRCRDAVSGTATSPSYSRRSSIWCLRGFWDLGAHGFVRLFHRLTTDTFANALEG